MMSQIQSLDQLRSKINTIEAVDTWRMEDALKFGAWVYRDRCRSVDILSLLASVTQKWDDTMVYTIVYDEQEDGGTLLNLLHDTLSTQTSLRATILMSLSHIYRALDRIDHFVHLNPEEEDMVHWIQHPKHLSSVAVGMWIDTPVSSEQQKEWNEKELAAAASILTLLTIHKLDSWVFEMDETKQAKLLKKLDQQVERLDDMDMPFTSFTILALEALALRSALHSKGLQSPTYSTTSYITHAVFHESEWAPRWTKHNGNASLVNVVFLILRIQSMDLAIEDKDRMAAFEFVADNLEHTTSFGEPLLRALHFVVTFHRSAFLNFLNAKTSFTNDSIGKIASFVVSRVNSEECLISSSLFRIILDIRRKNACDDDFSATFWSAVHKNTAERLMRTSVSALAVASKRPFLLSIFSSLYLIIVMHPVLSLELFQSLPPETLNGLIAFLRSEKPGSTFYSLDSIDSTPETCNLSRLQSDEEINITGGHGQISDIDSSLSLAVSSILGGLVLVQGNSVSEHIASFQRRARNAIFEFAFEKDLFVFSIAEVTQNDCIWRLRLHKALLLPESEEIFSRRLNLYHEAHLQMERKREDKINHLSSQLREYQEQLQDAENRVQTSNEMKSSMKMQLDREKVRLMEKNSREMIELGDSHKSALSSLEKKVSEYGARIKALESELHNSEQAIEQCRQEMSVSEQNLRDKDKLISGLNQTESFLRTELTKMRSNIGETKDKLIEMERQQQVSQRELSTMERKLREQTDLFDDAKAANISLQQSLENLFGDLCGLAQAYEEREKEAKDRDGDSAKIALLKEKLEAERSRRRQVEEQQKHIKFENETLSRKYERAKQKLQEERDMSRNESRFHGPSQSYFGHLNANREHLSSKTSRPDKENAGDIYDSTLSRPTKGRRYRKPL